MLHCILIANREGNVLLERFFGVPPEDRSQWRTFLMTLGRDHLGEAREEEHFIAVYREYVVVYCPVQDIVIFTVGNDEYDELGLVEVMNTIVASLKDLCKKGLRESNLVDRYGRACLALDEIMAQGIFEHTNKDRIRRLAKLNPM